MWFKLAKATFTNHLGPMSKLSNQVQIDYSIEGFDADTTSVSKTNDKTTTIILTLKNNYTYTHNASNVTVTSNFVSVSGTPSYDSSTKKLTIVLTKPTEIEGNHSISITVTGAVYVPPVVEPDTPGTYTITYKYMFGSTKLQDETTESVPAGIVKTFSISNAPTTIGNYTVNSVSPESATIDRDITVTYNYTATSGGGGGSALDLSTLSLAHCGSSKLGTGNKENLTYNQTTHELKVNNPGWYKVSYFTTPVQVGTEIEYRANYSTSNTGNFVGIYKQEDLVDGIAEANGSFWPAPSGFGVYAPGQGGNDFIYIWDKKNAKTKTADGLEGDYFNKKTIKLKLLATGTEVYVDGVKLTWASGATAATLTEGVNYYLGFHNNNSSGTSASTVASQTITYIGPIR